jgi:serine/threonine-protein kinase
MSLSGPPPEPSPADDLFARWLDQRERGEDPDFAQFCAAHAEHGRSLAFLHDNWQRLEEMLRAAPEDRGPHDFRYQIGEVIARGGMGVVMRAFDRVLQRTVAIKLSHKNNADPRAESRFLDEARITGQLDHPGIVPIHDLGQDAERRSYFTMPLVRGRTLAEIIGSLHAGEPEWSLPRVLSVLLVVCDAVASAHAKGVIHRDLKPGNVMVGRFGEVYVMDWGLARVMNETDRRDIRLREVVEPQSSVHSGRSDLAGEDPDSPLITMDGDVVGTPAYMAPEQARGEVERVGPRADVYAAGAMLYHAIAGEMPYVGRSRRISSRTVLARVLDGPPRPLLEVKPGAPAELVAICEQAMAREPEDRYPGMRELAADLRAFLEVRVVRAYGGGTWTELGKWVRRNRALAAAGAGLVLALLAGLGVSLSFRKSAGEHAARAEAGFTASLDAVDQMMLRVAEARLDQVPGAEQVRRQLLQDARQLYERFLAEQGNRPELLARVARTHFELAKMHRLLGELDDAEKQGRIGIARYDDLLAANPDDAGALYWRAYCWYEVGSVLVQRGRSGPGEEAVLRAQAELAEALERHPGERRLLVRQVDVVHTLAQIAYRAGRREPAIELQKQAVQRAAALLAAAPDREARLLVAVEYQTLGGTLEDLERYAEAEQPLRQAVAAYEALLAESPRETRFREGLARSLMSMDFVLRSKDDLAASRAAVDRALELFRDLAAEFPRRPDYHSVTAAILSNRATMLQSQGQQTEALADLEEAIRLQRLALAQAPDHKQFRARLANHLGNRLVSLQALGRWRELAERAEEMADLGPDSVMHLQFAGVFQLMAAALAGADQTLPAGEAERRSEELVQSGVARLRAAMALGFHAWRRLGTHEFDGVRQHPAVRALLDDMRSAELTANAAASSKLPANNFERKPVEASGTPANAEAGKKQ